MLSSEEMISIFDALPGGHAILSPGDGFVILAANRVYRELSGISMLDPVGFDFDSVFSDRFSREYLEEIRSSIIKAVSTGKNVQAKLAALGGGDKPSDPIVSWSFSHKPVDYEDFVKVVNSMGIYWLAINKGVS